MTNIDKSIIKQRMIDDAVREYASLPLLDRNIRSISKKYGINYKTLTKYLKLNDVEINKHINACHFKYDFFHTIDTEEKAYWFGFLCADGTVSSRTNEVRLGLALKDIDHLQKFNDALNYPKGMRVSRSHQFGYKSNLNTSGEPMYMVSTGICNESLKNDLVSKGCVPNKSLILTFPDADIFVASERYSKRDLILHFIRGYFDGDGTLGLYAHSKKNPKKEESLMFVGTRAFLEGVREYLGDGFLMQKRNFGPLVFRLGYSTSKAFRAAELLYKNATIYLERKYNIYLEMCHHKSRKNGKS